jgi:hypothetical protein
MDSAGACQVMDVAEPESDVNFAGASNEENRPSGCALQERL